MLESTNSSVFFSSAFAHLCCISDGKFFRNKNLEVNVERKYKNSVETRNLGTSQLGVITRIQLMSF